MRVAEPVVREFSPGMKVNLWGCNGQAPGPTIAPAAFARATVASQLPPSATMTRDAMVRGMTPHHLRDRLLLVERRYHDDGGTRSGVAPSTIPAGRIHRSKAPAQAAVGTGGGRL